MGATVRPTRRDAARNHQLLLDAGREVLGELGPDAGMEQIAARAGVGVGTVYRHFPNKDALIDDLVELVTAEITAAGEQAMTREDGAGLEEFLRALGRSFLDHRNYAALLLRRKEPDCAADGVRAQLAELTSRAKDAGRLGPQAQVGDVMTLVWAMRGVVETAGDAAPRAWERFLDLHLAALRSPEATSERKAITPAQLKRVVAR